MKTRNITVKFMDKLAKREVWSLVVTTVPANLPMCEARCFALDRAYKVAPAVGINPVDLCSRGVYHTFA